MEVVERNANFFGFKKDQLNPIINDDYDFLLHELGIVAFN